MAATRARLAAMQVRVVFEIERPDAVDLHLHPHDVPGALVAVDTMDPPGSWRWGGPEWTGRAPATRGGIAGLTVAVPDPPTAARRWAAVAGLSAPAGPAVEFPAGQRVDFITGDPGLVRIVFALPGSRTREPGHRRHHPRDPGRHPHAPSLRPAPPTCWATVEDGVAVLTMNRPDRRNALSEAMVDALARTLATVERDDSVGCVVLTGAGGASRRWRRQGLRRAPGTRPGRVRAPAVAAALGPPGDGAAACGAWPSRRWPSCPARRPARGCRWRSRATCGTRPTAW